MAAAYRGLDSAGERIDGHDRRQPFRRTRAARDRPTSAEPGRVDEGLDRARPAVDEVRIRGTRTFSISVCGPATQTRRDASSSSRRHRRRNQRQQEPRPEVGSAAPRRANHPGLRLSRRRKQPHHETGRPRSVGTTIRAAYRSPNRTATSLAAKINQPAITTTVGDEAQRERSPGSRGEGQARAGRSAGRTRLRAPP